MGHLSKIQRVIYRHDWQCDAEWACVFGELADLTEEEIDGLARSEQQSRCADQVGALWVNGPSNGLKHATVENNAGGNGG